jgi:putative Holliday junction resolvase
VDVGTVRVGVAASDPAASFAFPVTTLAAGPHCAAEVAAIVAEREAVEVLVGLPLTMAGEQGASADMARDFAERLRPLIAPVAIRFADERLTTVVGTRALAAAGRRGRAARQLVDQAAAVAMLQSVLDGGR